MIARSQFTSSRPDHVAGSASILVLNAGSSSLKFAIFAASTGSNAMVRGKIEDLDEGRHLIARDGAANVLAESKWSVEAEQAGPADLAAILDFATDHLGPHGLAAVGHRIVHGGLEHETPALVTPALLASLEALTPLDPLHMPLNLAPIRAIAAAHPGTPQVACFDTSFHRTMPREAQSFALPRAVQAAGVRRYGFHGLSFEFVAGRLAQLNSGLAQKKVVIAHLGSGASLCALKGGVSVATTMGFSTLDGLVMSTRCGSLDAGVVLYLTAQGHSRQDIEDMLYHRSGLLGVSGISGDLRVLSTNDDPHAQQAIDLFVYRLVCEIGAMAAALGGLDGLVFTAGIGEHDSAVRATVCERLLWLGIRLDGSANASNATRINALDSAVQVLVIPTDEEAVIARHTEETIRSL